MTQLMNENGIRCDGRKVDQLRSISIKVGVLKNADGSAYIEFGKNKILAGIFGPRDVHPKHMANQDSGILRCRYHMSPFSVTERKIADQIVLNINNEEDKEGQADMTIAYMPNLGKITLMQLDGILSPSEYQKCIQTGISGCKQVYEIQRKALMEKYFGNETP